MYSFNGKPTLFYISSSWLLFLLGLMVYLSMPVNGAIPFCADPALNIRPVLLYQHNSTLSTSNETIIYDQCLPIATATPLPLSALALLISLISTMVSVCFSMDRSLHYYGRPEIFSITFTFLLVLPLIIQSINNSVTAPV